MGELLGGPDAAVLRGYRRERLAVAAVLAAAAAAAFVVTVASLATVRRVEARSVHLPATVVEHLTPGSDGWERLRVTYRVGDELHATVRVSDAGAYRVGQRVDLLVDPVRPRAQLGLASELPNPWLPGAATGIALGASAAIAARSTRWARRLRRLVLNPSAEAVRVARARVAWGVRLALSELDDPDGVPMVSVPLMASQQELVERDEGFPVVVRWDPRDPGVIVVVVDGRVLWPRGRARPERHALVSKARPRDTASDKHRSAERPGGDQAASRPGRPASTTKDARVVTGASGRET